MKNTNVTAKRSYYILGSFLILFSSLFFFFSCLNIIELDIPKGSEDDIAIVAKIINSDPPIFSMEISQLYTYTVQSRNRVKAESVTLIDKKGNELVIPPRGDANYYYEFDESDQISIVQDNAYKLRVEMPDGRIFESSFEILNPVPKIKNIHFEVVDRKIILDDLSTSTTKFIEYSVDTDLFISETQEKSYLRWEAERVYKVTMSPIDERPKKICYLTEKAGLNVVEIYSGSRYNKSSLENHFVFDEPITEKYGEGLYFFLIQESLTPEAYSYWESVKKGFERKDYLYPDPSGKVLSNFQHINGNENVYGYFYLTNQDTIKIGISPEAAQFPATRCPSRWLLHDDGSCKDLLCCDDCEAFENSTTTVPDYWEL